jgi:hypothetical protein
VSLAGRIQQKAGCFNGVTRDNHRLGFLEMFLALRIDIADSSHPIFFLIVMNARNHAAVADFRTIL